MSTLRANVCKKLGLSATASQSDIYRAALGKLRRPIALRITLRDLQEIARGRVDVSGRPGAWVVEGESFDRDEDAVDAVREYARR